MKSVPFQQISTGLIAQNDRVRLQIFPVYNTWVFEENCLSEDIECQILVQILISGTPELFISGDLLSGVFGDGSTLWGRINTGDRPGFIYFTVCVNGQTALCADLQVRPSKLEYETHHAAMKADLERICRDLLYALPHQNRIVMRLDKSTGTALDFWHIIHHLFTQLQHALHHILKQPNQCLTTCTTQRPVVLSTGRDPETITHLMRTPSAWVPLSPFAPIHALSTHRGKIGCTHVIETHRYPTSNTLVNRHLVAQLQRLSQRAQALAQILQSQSHIVQCRTICTSLNYFLKSPVFRQVTSARPHEPFPQFLNPFYRQTFALINDLNCALAPAQGAPFQLSYRDTPTLYEYWAWVTIIHTLCEMGFSPTSDSGLFHLTHRGFTFSLSQGESSVIHMTRGNRHIRCFYNPTYTAISGRTLTHDLRPDIIIETHAQTLHAFDAKYRREKAKTGWIPLRDDIDKMHAYRDAIGQIVSQTFERTLKSAVVLFPAPKETAYHQHPFYKSLPYGIGGLPLLPGDHATINDLRNYLSDHILK